MEQSLLILNDLTKKYKGSYALNHFSVSIRKGGIYGLVGKNGAGKTTLMRILTGVAFPDSGTIEIFDQESGNCRKADQKQLFDFRKKMGSIVEYPALFGDMSAKDNIIMHGMVCGVKEDAAGIELLDMVGLTETGKKKVRNFSLGMKQRLGIALSLLNQPEILVLDEPINGLDPIGIAEIRNLLLKINRERRITILISSHILGELHQLATDYIFIDEGKLLKSISAEELERLLREKNMSLEDYYVELLQKR